jgi:hypothetical protein
MDVKEEVDCREIEFYRAHGEIICPDCGKEYWRHPWFMECLGMDDQPYLKRLCNGDLVKL